MIRIVHISDLHLASAGALVLRRLERTLLQRKGKLLLDTTGVSLNVKAHDQKRLDALDNL